MHVNFSAKLVFIFLVFNFYSKILFGLICSIWGVKLVTPFYSALPKSKMEAADRHDDSHASSSSIQEAEARKTL